MHKAKDSAILVLSGEFCLVSSPDCVSGREKFSLTAPNTFVFHVECRWEDVGNDMDPDGRPILLILDSSPLRRTTQR
jgi:hypothetical protein